jgi:hypothetical protein
MLCSLADRCNTLRPSTSFLLGPYTLLRTLFLNTVCFYLMYEITYVNYMKTTGTSESFMIRDGYVRFSSSSLVLSVDKSIIFIEFSGSVTKRIDSLKIIGHGTIMSHDVLSEI